MNREELIQMLGLPPDATDDQIKESIGELKRIADDKAAAEERAKAQRSGLAATWRSVSSSRDCMYANAASPQPRRAGM